MWARSWNWMNWGTWDGWHCDSNLRRYIVIQINFPRWLCQTSHPHGNQWLLTPYGNFLSKPAKRQLERHVTSTLTSFFRPSLARASGLGRRVAEPSPRGGFFSNGGPASMSSSIPSIPRFSTKKRRCSSSLGLKKRPPAWKIRMVVYLALGITKYIYIMVFNREISGNLQTIVLNGWWWILSLTMFDCQMFFMTSCAGISKAFPLPSWWHNLQWLQWCTNATSAVDQKRKHYLSLLSHSSGFSMTKAVEVQNLMHSMSSWVKLNWPKYRLI